MNQKNIREWNGNQYTAQEGADIIQELHERTSHNEDGYNSIAELGTIVKGLVLGGTLYKDGYIWRKGQGNESTANYELGDAIEGIGTLFPGYAIHGIINTYPMTDKNQHITILSSEKL